MHRPARIRPAVGLALLVLGACRPGHADEAIGPLPPYAPVAEALAGPLAQAVGERGIPAVSIALVDGDRIVWARGFGFADAAKAVPATAETLYRVGSVSKLFTDIAAMQLVERGRLDLDAPVQNYLPEFRPENPSGKPITLRQLMAHRSGLVRESPVGHYFDPTEPSVASTVDSLNRTRLVHEPGSRTKYSNAGVTVVGHAVERVEGVLFASYVKKNVLGPLGMARSDFSATPDVRTGLARGLMWAYDGRTFDAPTFRFGIEPAGNLYASVEDLGRFLIALFAEGRGLGGPVLKPETLRSMYGLQFAGPEATSGFGLGFAVSRWQGRLRVGHGGAVYGFATEVAALPEQKLGVVVAAAKDCANGLTTRLADNALRLILAARQGEPIPALARSEPVPPEEARRLVGHYGDGRGAVELALRRGGLRLIDPNVGPREVRKLGDGYVVDDILDAPTPPLAPTAEGIRLGRRSLARSEPLKPAAAPERWLGLIGEYGWDHDVLTILEHGGRLYALIEWFFPYPLEELAPDVFAFPAYGLYSGERLLFTRGEGGRASKVEAASVGFERRRLDGEDGSTFKIKPVRPLDELRAEAKSARPPAEAGDFRAPDLVDLTTLNPTIKLDVRYATADNFLGTPVYTSARAFLQRPAAEALGRAHKALVAKGYGLLIHDAYRPWSVTKVFWEATPASGKGFVADPAKGSKHNRGCAVDLTLYDLATGRAVAMVGGYDEFSPRSNPDYPGGTALQRWHRDLLRRAMEAEGFAVNEVEWWHFDFKDWPEYPILNRSFEELGTP